MQSEKGETPAESERRQNRGQIGKLLAAKEWQVELRAQITFKMSLVCLRACTCGVTFEGRTTTCFCAPVSVGWVKSVKMHIWAGCCGCDRMTLGYVFLEKLENAHARCGCVWGLFGCVWQGGGLFTPLLTRPRQYCNPIPAPPPFLPSRQKDFIECCLP